jgi:hypothetical protein
LSLKTKDNGFSGLGLKNDSFGLKIWVLKSPRWFLRLGLKTKPASVCWLLHKINGSRSARDTHQDLAVCFAWMQVGLVFSSLKDRRRRPEGGCEWEPIKIPHRNLACIPKSTRRPSLLTRPRPHSYSKAVGPRNRASNHSGDTEQCQQNHVQDRR